METIATSSNAAKYATGNPIVRRLLERFLRRVVDLATASTPRRVVDLGCGEGLVGERLFARLPGIEYRGIELSSVAVAEARNRLGSATLVHGDVLEVEPEAGWADLALCLEVLEHLETPDAAVARIAQWTAKCAIVSVPYEPWFRLGNLARGKYLRHGGNHPEHVQQFGRRSLEALLQPHFPTVSVEVAFPWLIAVGEKR